MKVEIRRLYDICNVLTSLGMLEKMRLPDTNKPAYKWLGITQNTHNIFDADHQASGGKRLAPRIAAL